MAEAVHNMPDSPKSTGNTNFMDVDTSLLERNPLERTYIWVWHDVTQQEWTLTKAHPHRSSINGHALNVSRLPTEQSCTCCLCKKTLLLYMNLIKRVAASSTSDSVSTDFLFEVLLLMGSSNRPPPTMHFQVFLSPSSAFAQMRCISQCDGHVWTEECRKLFHPWAKAPPECYGMMLAICK